VAVPVAVAADVSLLSPAPELLPPELLTPELAVPDISSFADPPEVVTPVGSSLLVLAPEVLVSPGMTAESPHPSAAARPIHSSRAFDVCTFSARGSMLVRGDALRPISRRTRFMVKGL